MALKKEKNQKLNNDQIRKLMLEYFYERNKHATSSMGKKGSAVKISCLKSDLKRLHGLKSQEVQSNLTYLISQGWIEPIELEKQVKILSDSLGLSAGSRIFSRNQNQNTEEQAEKVIEFIKDNYKQFIDSITSDINNRANVVYIQAPNNVTEQLNTVNTEVVDDTLEVLDILDKDNDKAKKVFEVLDDSTEEQEAFAFEESADMEALERFMGL